MFRILNRRVGVSRGTPLVHCKPEVVTFESHGRHFALDANTLCLIEGDEGFIERVAEKAKEADGSDEPVAGGLFAVTRAPSFPLPGSPTAFVELTITTDCNLACRYCYEAEMVQSRVQYMDFELAKRALTGLFSGSPGDLRQGATGNASQLERTRGAYRVCLYGGEPLMHFELFKQVVPWFRKWAADRGHTTQFSTTTNGTLITPEVAKFLTENNFELIVSLDGPPACHDDQRPFRNGETGSYEATWRGLCTLREAGYPMGRICLRATFTGEGADLYERARHLLDLCDAGYGGYISIEPSCLSESGCAHLPDGHALSFSLGKLDGLFKYEYERLAELYATRLKQGKPTAIHHLTTMIKRILYGRQFVNECGAGRGYLSVNADGTIYPCHRHLSPPIGHIDKGGVDHALAAPWQDNRLYMRSRCPRCPYRHACGGGCRIDSLVLTGDLRVPSPTSCWFKRRFIAEAAWVMSEVGPGKLSDMIPEAF